MGNSVYCVSTKFKSLEPKLKKENHVCLFEILGEGVHTNHPSALLGFVGVCWFPT